MDQKLIAGRSMVANNKQRWQRLARDLAAAGVAAELNARRKQVAASSSTSPPPGPHLAADLVPPLRLVYLSRFGGDRPSVLSYTALYAKNIPSPADSGRLLSNHRPSRIERRSGRRAK